MVTATQNRAYCFTILLLNCIRACECVCFFFPFINFTAERWAPFLSVKFQFLIKTLIATKLNESSMNLQFELKPQIKKNERKKI